MYSHNPKKKWHTYLEEDRVWTVIRETCGRAYGETNELHNENSKDDVFWDKYTFSFTCHLWKYVKQDLSPSYTHLHGLQDEIQHVELEFPLFGNGNDEVISVLSSTFSFLKNCTNLKSVTLRNNPYGCSPTFLDIHRDYENENWIDGLCHKSSDIGPLDRLGTFAEIGRFTARPSADVKRKMIFDISPEIYTTGTSGAN
ncbi:uncharacterized protein PAC_15755 [Phialocephala subalpina]|uniref:Uncharacterized protein n=1 Tax=Phialocephala subalpina TaxID=576137 RepID=A0A1L7XLC5_9HELO|nr:uncharacterized protein PAC_15755 [Phialocephala subalpina]